ncbi:MAG: adenylate/guanylate cyclase domain-containing protein [Pseudomonadota bacterium]
MTLSLPKSLFRHLGLREEETAHMPARVAELVSLEEERSERLICWVQLSIVATFATLYFLAPRPIDAADSMFEPVPIAIGAYLLFTVARLTAAYLRFLPGWLLVLSMIVDVVLLYTLIWSFHIDYKQPAAFYLKVPTFAYIFVFIAVRALRFDPRFVLSQGLFAAAGWVVMVGYAISQSGPEIITSSFVAYLTDNLVLIGAEFDKIFTILLVTGVLSLALYRARRTLLTAVREGAATREMRRFFGAGVADRITSAETAAMAGDAVDRDAAILILDLRGFSQFAADRTPREVVDVLTAFHGVVMPIITREGGVVDKFLGDGVMATFGAVSPSDTAAADALRALQAIMQTREDWLTHLSSKGLPDLPVNGGPCRGVWWQQPLATNSALNSRLSAAHRTLRPNWKSTTRFWAALPSPPKRPTHAPRRKVSTSPATPLALWRCLASTPLSA